VEELDAELSELERQQRAADMAREELNRRQSRIKVRSQHTDTSAKLRHMLDTPGQFADYL
jgi:FtsZ-binding cell division protein ZapB